MGKKRSAKARQREAERRRQLSQHGVKVMGSNGKPLRAKGGMKKKSSKGSLSLLEKQLGGANPFATKRNAGKSIKLRQRTLLRDYKSRNKSTVFADKRLGENNPVSLLKKKGNTLFFCVCHPCVVSLPHCSFISFFLTPLAESINPSLTCSPWPLSPSSLACQNQPPIVGFGRGRQDAAAAGA